MKVNINTDVNEIQFARFANTAKSKGMSISAYLRKLIAENGTDAEWYLQKEKQKDELFSS